MAPTTAATAATVAGRDANAALISRSASARPPRRCLDACKQKDAETRRQWRAACWRLRDYICFRPIYSVPRLPVCTVHAAPARSCLCMRGARRRNHRRAVSSITFPYLYRRCSSISRRPACAAVYAARPHDACSFISPAIGRSFARVPGTRCCDGRDGVVLTSVQRRYMPRPRCLSH